jgi:hypothetical protein
MGVTVVISYSSVISLIKLSINIAVLGSNPELVHHKTYLGLLTIATATRFCIPPEI